MRYVLGIESSCDETAAAVIEGPQTVVSNSVASQVKIHVPYGGVVPELASREHLANIDAIVSDALQKAGIPIDQIDGIAVTQGPGLAGCLLVGLCYAKALSYGLRRPFIGVNHIEGHIYSVVFENPPVEYPALALVVSGGHTNLFSIPEPERYELVAHTRDDAAGEALDKVAKLLGLGYPGGPIIDRLSRRGDPRAFPFTLPKMGDGRLDFSFSGLKTAVIRHVQSSAAIRAFKPPLKEEDAPGEIVDLVASFQNIVVKTLLDRLDRVAEELSPRTIILAGGVACNSQLRKETVELGKKIGVSVYSPSPLLTTDNAAMIAAAAYPKLARGESSPLSLTAEPAMRLQNVNSEYARSRGNVRYRL